MAAYASPAATPGTINSTNSTETHAGHFEALTALLALRVTSGSTLGGLSSAELLDAADESDPDDHFLYRELEARGKQLTPLAQYADRLVDGSYNAAAAFEKLMTDRFRTGLGGHSTVALTAPAIELVAAAAVELGRTVGSDPSFVDPTLGGSDLLLGVLHRLGDAGSPTFLTTKDDDGAARLVRRRLRAHGVRAVPLDIGTDGSFDVPGPAVQMAQFPSPGCPSMGPDQILAGIEQILLQMDDPQRAVLIAPAGVLCDAAVAGTRVSGLRADLLRSGRVRAVIRLPQGLRRSQPRQAQALWVLGPSFAEVDIADRWTMVADLIGQELTPAAAQDLLADIAASMGDRAMVRAHSFRFARLVLTRSLLAARGSLVAAAQPTGAAQRRAADPAAAAVRADELLRLLTEESGAGQSPDLRILSTAAGPAAATPLPAAAIHQLLVAGALKYLQGNRLDPDDLAGAGSTRLIGTAELLTTGRSRSISLLDFTRRHPHGRLTEPGDIVFCTSPRPAAVVDTQGAAVVLFPARVLRINATKPRGLHPDVVAADINALPPAAKDWRNWRLRTVPESQHQALTDALQQIQHAQRLARERLLMLNELDNLIKDGVSCGSLSLAAGVPTEGNT
ncbi:hypothetical protein [Paenarthrobacter sp. Z7-10]|uniref:hypothetical protein n=1 Tax=Paenarthrobacter sp. Z7-10 TaxID=2787635 RepID=UPI0022A9C0B0|nr:hypothetical protein [Paenarthrobacter sp. Z7-10]